MVEVFVDECMDRGELLETSHLAKSEHRSFSSPEWLMRVFGAVVRPPRSFLFTLISNDFHGGSV